MKLDRITSDPNVMGGKACVRGTRVAVATVLKLLAGGMTPEAIMQDYPYLEPDDVAQSVAYAAMLADDRVLDVAR